MNDLASIVQIGFYEGLTWFPIVLAIGILYKYLKVIDVSIDGITVISSIAFTTSYNFSSSLILAFIVTGSVAMISYAVISFLTNELKINNILAGIVLSLILHSLSVLCVGESLCLKYENLVFLNSHYVSIAFTLIIGALVEIFFRTNLGVRLKVTADNPNINISSNPRLLILLIYIIAGFVLSVGVVQYTCKLGLSRSGGGFEFLITALSSFLFTDRIIDLIISAKNMVKENYSYKKFVVYSLFQSPVFKALLGSILFQIIVLLIIYYTSNPAYWKLIFGLILFLTVAKPHLNRFLPTLNTDVLCRGIVLRDLTFKYDLGYEEKVVLQGVNFSFEEGVSVIWGSNGVGKTSLLKLIGGKLTPQHGSIIKNGVDITYFRQNKRNVFFMNQVPYDSLSIRLTVFENVAAVSANTFIDDLNIAGPLNKHLPNQMNFDIELGYRNSFWVQKVETLSGGQAQKLNMFLCSISDADLILADEPTSGMDSNNFNLFITFINNMKAMGKTIILVTHDERMRKLEGNHLILTKNKLNQIQQRYD